MKRNEYLKREEHLNRTKRELEEAIESGDFYELTKRRNIIDDYTRELKLVQSLMDVKGVVYDVMFEGYILKSEQREARSKLRYAQNKELR